MLDQFMSASTSDQIMLAVAIFCGLVFLFNALAVVFQGGRTSALPGILALILIILVILT